MTTHRLFPLAVLLLASCTGTDKADSGAADTDAAEESDADADTDADTDFDGVARTVAGTITWNVDFNATAEADGAEDCAYTRTYFGVEDNSAPWLCPGCDAVFLADAEITEGREACFDVVSTSDPADTEWLGYGGGVWYRGSGAWLSERGPATEADGVITVEQVVDEADSGGDYAFDIRGALTLGEQPGDPLAGWTPAETYACGWPKADPAAYEGDYVAAVGATLPDGVFHDVCEDAVRLHDFAGTYLVVEISAMDCPPCQDAASEEEAFIASMAEEGIAVHVVTMLAPSLSNTAGTPTTDELQEWIDAFDLASPVLADRVWGLSVYGQYAGDDYGYPTFFVVAPDLEIIDINVGFGSYDTFADVIRADAE
jgi:hypothetical protein